MKILCYATPQRSKQNAEAVTPITGIFYFTLPEGEDMVAFDGTCLFLLSPAERQKIIEENVPTEFPADWLDGTEVLTNFVDASHRAIRSVENILAKQATNPQVQFPFLALQPMV